MASASDLRIRRVRESAVDAVTGLVHELAEYVKAPQKCHLTPQQLCAALFCEKPALFGHVAEVEGQVVGCSLWFLNFSPWHGTHGIYLEVLYVQPAHRGQGLGKALLSTLAKECVQRGYSRLEWSVRDWNALAIGFYTSVGAAPDGATSENEQTTFRLTDNALARLDAAAAV